MRLDRGILITLLWSGSSLARADALVFDIGTARDNTVLDSHMYAKTLQDEFFRGKRLEGMQIEGSYRLVFNAIEPFMSALNFGLGHVQAAVSESYPGGSLKLERSSSFVLIGYRLQTEKLLQPVILGAELTTVKSLAGTVKFKSAAARENYQEESALLEFNAPTLSATVGYRLNRSWLLDAKLRLASKNVPNFFLGVAYDIAGL